MRAAGGPAAEYDLAMGTGPADDYYALLGVDADANRAALRRAWRRLAQRWHPDRAGPEATVMFQRISAAYAVLSDPIARAAYDRRHGPRARGSRPPSGTATTAPGAATTAPGAATTAPGAPIRRRAPGVMLTRLSRPLNVLLARGVARRAEGDVIELFLDTEEATQGGMVTISMRVPVRCPCVTDGTAACARCDSLRTVEDLFSAWLAVPPEVADGVLLTPSALLPGMIRPVSFRVRVCD
jgi:DnaJ-class molecular chaperone